MLIIKNGMIVTSDLKNKIIENGSIAIENDVIMDVGSSKDIEETYSSDDIIDANGKIVMPGTIDCHCHMYNSLVAGGFQRTFQNIPDVCLLRFEDFWWPYIEDQLTKDEIFISAQISSIQMIKSGTTSVVDILEAPYSAPGVLDREAEAIRKVGMRGFLSLETSNRIDEEKADLAAKENLDFVKKWNIRDDIVKGKFCPHTTYTCTENLLKKIRKQADKYGGGIQIHLHEGKDEGILSLISYRKTPVKFYEDIGFLGPDLLAAQVVFPKDEEIQILKKHDVKIAHNPTTKHGVCPAVKMRQAGLTLGLGTDGFNTIFQNMNLASIIHKGHNEDYRLMPPEEVFMMATRDGAKAAGYGDLIGSIEPNKKADIVILDPIPYVPLTSENVVGQIVKFGSRLTTDTVLVNGKIIMKDGKMLTVNEDEINILMKETVNSFWEKQKKKVDELPHGIYRLMKRII